MSEQIKKIALIGGGPSGLIAAQFLAALNKYEIHLYEQKSSVGRKFLIAGRGGLNLTHTEDTLLFNKRYGTAEDFLTPHLSGFTPEDLRNWAQELGIDTFVGSSGRVFPKEMKSTALMRAWTTKLSQAGVHFHLRYSFEGFGDQGQPLFRDKNGDIHETQFDAVLLGLGGASYPHLGATASWVTPLEERGVKVNPFRPVNCGFNIRWSDHLLKHEGAPLKNVSLTMDFETSRGDAVITQYGIEGGLLYSLSRSLVIAVGQPEGAAPLLDFRPDMPFETVLEKLSAPRGKQSLSSFLRKKLKFSALETALLHEFTPGPVPADPPLLAELIKGLPIRLDSPRPLEQAISSSGGIDLSEFDDMLMLKKCPGWFAAGEMIDWDAPTGGYLLQACFSTGIAAAKGIERWLEK
ncbi:MAG: TIGR03862 family flavoprotein [Sneathiellales bacterium]|nr:TIGR03862 family flavoprotein [Sneathiellales bacterium]